MSAKEVKRKEVEEEEVVKAKGEVKGEKLRGSRGGNMGEGGLKDFINVLIFQGK